MKLQGYLSEKVAVNGHGCRTALKVGVKLKEIKTSFLPYYVPLTP